MHKKRIESIIIAILIIIFVYAAANAIITLRKNAKQKLNLQAKVKLAGSSEFGQIKAQAAVYAKERQLWESLRWVRCPFSGKTYSSGAVTLDLQLAGIIWDKTNPLAIINDNIVKIGDQVGEKTVVDIKQDRVILNNGTQDFELKLE